MTVGEELEHARQRCGLSLQDVSARTKVSIERLHAIERGDGEGLPPLVYLRGYVRSYASEVGLDPDHVAERYLAQFEAATALDEFETEASEEPLPAVLELGPLPAKPNPSLQPPILDLSPRPAEPAEGRASDGWPGPVETVSPGQPVEGPAEARADEPDVEPEPAPEHEPQPALETVVAPAADGARPWRPAQFRQETLGTVTRDNAARPAQPLHAGKLAGGVAAAVLAGFILSAQLDELPSDRTTVNEPGPSGRAAEPSPASRRDATPAASSPRTHAAEEQEPAREPARADARDEPADVSRAGADLSVEPVSGAWTLVNRIDASNYPAFANLTLVYRLQLKQQGDRVMGSGEKWSENGRAISPRARTPIALEGTLDGRRLELRFTEKGRRRTTAGTLIMQVADDGLMRGRFASEAAQSRGTSRATRLR